MRVPSGVDAGVNVANQKTEIGAKPAKKRAKFG